jgi:predicted dehydrogenase
LHHAVAARLIDAGVHVLVEKPIAATIDEANDLARRAGERGIVLGVGHIERFNTAVQELRRRLEEGQGGTVIQLQARRVGPFPARIRDVGVIHDLAPHDIDIMRFLLGSEPVRAYAETRRHINTEHEDLLLGLLTFESGVIGTLDINWLTPTKTRELSVLCEKGLFVVDYIAQSLTFYENHAARPNPGAPRGVSEGPMTRYPVNFREPLRLELEAFRDAVRTGGPAPVTAVDGIAALRVAEALAASAAEECAIDIAPEVPA